MRPGKWASSAVVVTFSCTDVKTLFLKRYFTFIKGKGIKLNDIIGYSANGGSLGVVDTNIYVSEFLASSTHKVMMYARKLKKENKVHGFLIKGGKCYVAVSEGGSSRLVSSVAELDRAISDSTSVREIGVLGPAAAIK